MDQEPQASTSNDNRTPLGERAPQSQTKSSKKNHNKKRRNRNKQKATERTAPTLSHAKMDKMAQTVQDHYQKPSVDFSKLLKLLESVSNRVTEKRELSRKEREDLMWDLRLMLTMCEVYESEHEKVMKVRDRLQKQLENEPDAEFVQRLKAIAVISPTNSVSDEKELQEESAKNEPETSEETAKTSKNVP